jgi:hypothetical protein
LPVLAKLLYRLQEEGDREVGWGEDKDGGKKARISLSGRRVSWKAVMGYKGSVQKQAGGYKEFMGLYIFPGVEKCD